MTAYAAAGTAAATAQSQRVVIGGVLVYLDPYSFMNIAQKLREKGVLVIHGVVGVLSKSHVYAAPYQGVVFITKSKDPLPLTPDIEAREIRIPAV